MSMFIQNLLYSVLLIVSGMIILATLSHFRMKVARGLFLVLFAVSLVYIPFYFGGNVMLKLLTPMFEDPALASTFVASLSAKIATPFLLFQSVTLGMALFSIIIIIAALIAAVTITVEVIKYIRRCWNSVDSARKDIRRVLEPIFQYVNNSRFLYKRLERYRN